MTAYDRLRADALDALAGSLPQKGLQPDEQSLVIDTLSSVDFPAFLALLGTQGTGGTVGQPLLHGAADAASASPAVEQLHLGSGDVERALTAVFVHGATPDAALGAPTTRDVVMRSSLEQLATQVGAPITPDQATEAIQLLSTGEFFGDLASTVAAAAFAVRDLPIDVVHDVGHMPHRMLALVGAIALDLAGTPFIPLRVLEDLLADGKLDHPPAVLSHTMKCLLGFATLGTTAHTISDLIAPDNRSVRLAIVIYARANGIPLQESDLDLLRTQVLDTPTPDLGPVLVAAMSRFIDRSGKGQVLATLQQLAASRS
jgi:hypothetical protein